MKSVQYSAAGGVVVQRAVVPGLPASQTSLLLLDRPGRNEIRLPKGHVDHGESPEEAALRETCEETGYCDLRILADLGCRSVAFDYRGARYFREDHYFLMQLLSARTRPRPPEDAQQFHVLWTPYARAAGRLTFAIERQFTEDAVTALLQLPPL